MTRLTFQFLPKPGRGNSIEVKDTSGRIVHMQVYSDEFTEFHLDDGSMIEVLSNGDLRYSVTLDPHEEIQLDRIFEKGLATIRDLTDSPNNEYSVALLVNDADPISTYFDISEDISDLSIDKFNDGNPGYSEVNDNTVRISFRDQRRGVVF